MRTHNKYHKEAVALALAGELCSIVGSEQQQAVLDTILASLRDQMGLFCVIREIYEQSGGMNDQR